jgi:hypothetical protein
MGPANDELNEATRLAKVVLAALGASWTPDTSAEDAVAACAAAVAVLIAKHPRAGVPSERRRLLDEVRDSIKAQLGDALQQRGPQLKLIVGGEVSDIAGKLPGLTS